jgi:Domain of unknown function (DUF4055)
MKAANQLPKKIGVGDPVDEARIGKMRLDMINHIRLGLPEVRRNAQRYLPQYHGESTEEWSRRVEAAPWRPEFSDILRSLSSRPFVKPVEIKGDGADAWDAFAGDVDLQGNDLTVFCRDLFEDAMADGWACVMVEYPDMRGVETVADELAIAARPYFVKIRASDVLALQYETMGGVTAISHARIRETTTVLDGYAMKEVARVRVISPGRVELWEQAPNTSAFVLVDEIDTSRRGETSVPLVPLYIGTRHGHFTALPPLADLADMQIELFRAGSRQEEILTFAGAPMLAISGVESTGKDVHVGPKRVLYLPGSSDGPATAKYLHPDAAIITEVREQFASIIQDMRRLGMQPLMSRTGAATATATAIEAAKTHSTVQAWAIMLRDALEQAFVLAGQYAAMTPPRVGIHTDFIAALPSAEESRILVEAKKQGIVSSKTLREELQRRGVLGPQFDLEGEPQRLAEESEALEGEDDIDPATGAAVDTPPEDRRAPDDVVVGLSELREVLRARGR